MKGKVMYVKFARLFLVVALGAAMLVPSVASAKPAAKAPRKSKAVVIQGITKAKLDRFLVKRTAVFAKVAVKLQSRIDTAYARADEASAAGADVSAVYPLLEQAQTALDAAVAREVDVTAYYERLATATSMKQAARILKEARIAVGNVGRNFKVVRHALGAAFELLDATTTVETPLPPDTVVTPPVL